MSYPEPAGSAEAALATVREIAAEFGRTVVTADGAGPDVSAELSGSPAVTLVLYADGQAAVTVETVHFDLDPGEVGPFLRAVYDGTAYVHAVTKWWQFLLPLTAAGYWLVVPMPGERAYKELVPRMILTPWLTARLRTPPGKQDPQ
ncbi:hypothetical protein [Streptomyces sp. NBC_01465]|uniref:hypothetical protein n=1 Tax=Streptomyces sp. NBC_01465 TaxID=2903878 RepID=UPI002E30F523|nr:hypothetical protein [Streptomyces sp. NBC_01465]